MDILKLTDLQGPQLSWGITPGGALIPLGDFTASIKFFLHLKFWQDGLVGAQPQAQEMTLPLFNQKLIDAYHSATSFDVFFSCWFSFSYLFRSINGSSGSGRMISVNELPVSGRAMPLGRRPSTNRSTISNFDSGNESRSTTTSTVAAGRIKSVTNAEFAERPPQAYSRFDPLHCGLFVWPHKQIPSKIF